MCCGLSPAISVVATEMGSTASTSSETSSETAGFVVVCDPEFLREGSAIHDSLFPTELDPRPKVAVPFVTTDLASAEMTKYASNAFLATKISFINEIAKLYELVGCDVKEVAYGIGLDERIGARFLNAGIGWGGSCSPKDVAALRALANESPRGRPQRLGAA